MTVDTSDEAVEALANIMNEKAKGTRNRVGDAWGNWVCDEAAATLRALAAERDALRAALQPLMSDISGGTKAVSEDDPRAIAARAALKGGTP